MLGEFDSKTLPHRIFVVLEGREVESLVQQLKPGDVFRKEGVPGYWRCRSRPYLNENKIYTVDTEPTQLLLS